MGVKLEANMKIGVANVKNEREASYGEMYHGV